LFIQLERTIDVGFTLTVDGRLPDPSSTRSRTLWEEPEIFAVLSGRHPLAATPRRTLRFEIIWHTAADSQAVDAFSTRIQQALA
jgi:hypothetical protein